MASTPAAAAVPEAHLRMCKKIAQLTRVVYQLNLRVEDGDDRAALAQRRHGEELAAARAASRGDLTALEAGLREKDAAVAAARTAADGFRAQLAALREGAAQDAQRQT
jgi:uncharacterized protein involved in type VI secretion and phage assembly